MRIEDWLVEADGSSPYYVIYASEAAVDYYQYLGGG